MNDSAAAGPFVRTLLILIIALAATLAGAIAARHWLERDAAGAAVAVETRTAAVFREARPLPAFALVAHDGTPFGLARLQGRWSILFFGFTNCPDICPATLAQLAAVKRRLTDLPAAATPSVVMVSVDPRRDTPARLAHYVPYFDASFTGVTGTPEAIAALTSGLGVAVHASPESNGAYTVDHTAALFLVDPDGRLAAVFPTPHDPETIAADYRAIVGHRGRG